MAGASKETAVANAGNETADFVISFLKKLATVGLVWGWGYMNLSLGWLVCPIVLSVLRAKWKRESDAQRFSAQSAALIGERQTILNKMSELPSWVYFPDFDRAEWLNKILYKVWPSMNQFVRELCQQTIQPAIALRLSQYKMKSFSFDRLVLGRIPPRIGGIKVYDRNTDRNEIVLDADFFYAGDCDISFLCGTVKGGIKDFQIRGMIRVIMKPLISVMPLVGGLQIFFLNMPSVDFNLVGVADLLDMPGLSEILRKTILEQIATIMVLPNKLPISLSDSVPMEMLKTSEPEGVLRIHVIEAKHLMKKDFSVLGKGKSDPYAVITVGAQEFRTQTIDNTVNPKWDFWCECVVTSAIAQQLTIHVWDHDEPKDDETLGSNRTVDLSSVPAIVNSCVSQIFTVSMWDWDPGFPGVQNDDNLGRATIEVSRVQKKGILDTWITLDQAKHGMVHLRLTWLQLSRNLSDLPAALQSTQQLHVPSMSTAILMLYIDSARNLPSIRANKQPDVYLEATIGNQSQRTATMLRSADPVWEQGFTFLVPNPETNLLQLKLVDEKTGMNVGVLSYHINTLLEVESMEVQQQPYNLQHGQGDSRVIMSMTLRVLKYVEPDSSSEDEDEQDITVLKKELERQESNNSNVGSIKEPFAGLQKQPSKESVISVASSVVSAVVPPSSVVDEDTSLVDEPLLSSISAQPLSASPNLIHRNLSVTSSAGEAGLGRIQLTLRYSVQRQKLIVVVHKIANLPLPLNDPTNIPDPYVKLYLLPDRHKESKRKTAVMKDNCNPVYDEQFEYVISQGEMNSRRLEISVCTQKGWLSSGSNVMGQVCLNLADIDLTSPLSSWYDLQPASKD